jgi:hypothetical protein
LRQLGEIHSALVTDEGEQRKPTRSCGWAS